MALVLNRGNAFTQNTLNCQPPTCAVCGGLECLCRPRFFAGQLLTDEDLQRLDHYITAKNKLHNRYLIGWGVACGLEVVCDACDGMVTVRSGYALSPCGEDIIVCSDASVDVCSMIQKCKKKQPRDCQPAQTGGVDPCSDTTEDWILSICYNEQASRGVMPLKNTGAAACCSRCACGSSCSCGCQSSSTGCGCGGYSSGNGSNSCTCGTSTQTQTASTQTQCQPTVTCEGYRFEVCKVISKDSKTPQFGAIVQKFLCCLLKLGELFTKYPSSGNQQDVKNWCCAIRDNLLDFVAANPGYDCGLPQLLANMCQSDDPQQIGNDVGRFLLDFLQYCLCSAFLPPCPAPATDDCVPLATITVSRKNGQCTIQKVCNIDVRKFLVDLPNLGYWLSWIPFGAALRTLFSNLCCNALPWENTQFRPSNQVAGFASARATVRADNVAAPQPTADFMSLIFESTADRKVDLQALSMAAMGITDLKSGHNLSDLEMQYPFHALMLNQVGKPLVQSYLSGVSSGIIARAQASSAGGAVPAAQPAPPSPQAETQPNTNAQIADLKTQLDAMRQDLKQSQAQIDKLTKAQKKK